MTKDRLKVAVVLTENNGKKTKIPLKFVSTYSNDSDSKITKERN